MAKKHKVEHHGDLPAIPSSYSNIEHIAETPIPCQLMKGLQKKNADVSFLQSVASAAISEGSARYQTAVFGAASTEGALHAHFKKDLPAVSVFELPIQLKKKLVYRKYSA